MNLKKSLFERKKIENVDKVILVASGKGGVGKSTTAFNMALSLSQKGFRVGLLDADIYGPSLHLLAGLHEKPNVTDHKKIIPHQKFDLEMMSIAFLVDMRQPLIWRGPMAQHALNQLLFEVCWGASCPLDFLIIDTPPGTGDMHLSLAQKIEIFGAILVSTPQDIAFIDAIKAIEMFRKLNIQILGLIENMATFHCPHCENETSLFGKENLKNKTLQEGIPYIGFIPLLPSICASSDKGIPDQVKQYNFVADFIKNLVLMKNE